MNIEISKSATAFLVAIAAGAVNGCAMFRIMAFLEGKGFPVNWLNAGWEALSIVKNYRKEKIKESGKAGVVYCLYWASATVMFGSFLLMIYWKVGSV